MAIVVSLLERSGNPCSSSLEQAAVASRWPRRFLGDSRSPQNWSLGQFGLVVVAAKVMGHWGTMYAMANASGMCSSFGSAKSSHPLANFSRHYRWGGKLIHRSYDPRHIMVV